MKKKLAAVMICAAMVAMLGVGCGSKSSDDSSSKSETKKTLTEDDIKDSITHRIFRIYFIDGRINVTLREVGKRVHMGRSGVGKRIENFLKVSRNSHDSHLQ